MGVYDPINFKITGQAPEGSYRLVKAKFEAVCAEFDLELEEREEE